VRLLLELRAKLDVIDVGEGLEVIANRAGTARAVPDSRADVRAALVGLGYGADEIRDAVRDLPDGEDAGELLRHALRQLATAR
jgi:holliday junction DNA helicase RuvA